MKKNFEWSCKHTWKRSAYNTLWCLIGCSIGDFGTIVFFQLQNILWPTLYIMILAIINGLITSIILETSILLKQMNFSQSLKTALGMSFISMISMERLSLQIFFARQFSDLFSILPQLISNKSIPASLSMLL